MLKAQGVFKSYQTMAGKLDVLKGVDLEVKSGEMVAVVGASGVGKSTLLHILGTLDRPDVGQVNINDKEIFSLDDKGLAGFRNKTIGFVFQFHHLLPEFTCQENLILPKLIAGENKEEAMQKAAELLEEMGLKDRRFHRPLELSGGEQQRLAVARALVNSPQVVLADEPTGNLDSKSAENLIELLRNLNQNKKQTFIIATHNLKLSKIADKVFEMKEGKLFLEGNRNN